MSYSYNQPVAAKRVPTPTISILCFLLVAVLFNLLGLLLISTLNWRSIWVSALFQVFLIAGLPLLFTLVFRYDFKTTFSLRQLDLLTVFLCALAGLAAQFAVRLPDLLIRYVLQAIFGPLYQKESSGLTDGTVEGTLLATIALLFLAPTCEELLNRGFLMAGFYRNGQSSFWRTVLLVGLFFGLFHQYMYTFTGTALGGLVLAYLALTTGSITASMAGHFGFNFLPALVLWLFLLLKDKNGNLFGESFSDSGLMVITPDLVVSSIILTFLGSGLLFLLARAITRRAASRRTGLTLNYWGLVKDIRPDEPYFVQGDYYSAGWPYLYGFNGYVTENYAPDYWQTPGITQGGVIVPALAAISHFAAQENNQQNGYGQNQPYFPRYLRPVTRPTRPRERVKAKISTIIVFLLVFGFFCFTSLAEVSARAKGRECEQRPFTCLTLDLSKVETKYLPDTPPLMFYSRK